MRIHFDISRPDHALCGVKNISILSVLITAVLGFVVTTGSAVVAPLNEPTYGSAVVDGSYDEWALSNDFFAYMWEAGNPNKPNAVILSKLYLRYDCDKNVLYALVLRDENYIPLKKADDAWIKVYNLGNSPRVSGKSGNDGTPPDFMWVYSGNTLIGYEASFSLPEGTYSFEAHIQISKDRTSSTGRRGNYLTLVIDCPDIPSIDIEKATNGEDADTETGPVVAVGSKITWTYVVKNTGNVPLANVVVTDDQGMTPIYVGGDTNNDGILDPDETWTYEATGTAVAGQNKKVGTAKGTYDGKEVVDTDPTHYLGSSVSPCDQYNITFMGKTTVGNNTRFDYRVCATNNAPRAISHWTVELEVSTSGSIEVTKAVEGDCDEGTEFNICIDGPRSDCATFGCNGGKYTFSNLPFGTYNISEADPGEGWKYTINPERIILSGCNIKVLGASHAYTIGLDPTTGVTGIKFDIDIEKGTCLDFWFILEGIWETGTVDAAIKAGTIICYYDINGPVCDSKEYATVTNTRDVSPAISIEKATNGEDADSPTGPVLDSGDEVTWTYVVTNTGNVPLTDVYVTDDVIGPVAGPIKLNVGESKTFTKTGTASVGQYSNTAKANGTYQEDEVEDSDPSHYVVDPGPSITIEKATNGEDADEPTGPVLNSGDEVTWTYVVTNTGNVPLSNVYVTDDVIGPVAGPINLNVGESKTFTKTGTAQVGQYKNIATANGTYQDEEVTDTDPSHYLVNPAPSITIEKATNGEDADTPTGPVLNSGDEVTWTYVVTNTGNVPLTDVYVTDDVIGPVAGPIDLGVGESETFTKTGTAQVGQYKNVATANGTYQDEDVTDTDPSHYLGSELMVLNPGLEVYKTASPSAGIPSDAVTFTIIVKNTGEVPLNLEVNDSLPAGMSYVSADPYPDSVVENADGTTTIVWGPVLETLDPGNETTITLVGHIDEDIPKSASTTDTLTVLGSPDLGKEGNLAGEEVLWVQQFGGGGLADTIEGLIWVRVRLEVELAKMVELRERFDKGSARLVVDVAEGDLPGYEVYNYTNPATNERLVLFMDARGILTRSEYHNPGMDAVLTSEYGPDGSLIFDGILLASRMEGLSIDYDVPSSDFKIRTVFDYNTGDTLIETVNPKGEVIRRDYRKTPGVPKFKEFRLRNSVSATGSSDEGTVSDYDFADVIVSYHSELKLTKVASPIIARVGAVITYNFTVENVGRTTISDLELFDDRLNRYIDLNRTTLKPGEVAFGEAEYTVVSSDLFGPIVNNATVTGTDPQGDLIEDSDTAFVPLAFPGESSIVLTKTPDKTEVEVGGIVTYSFVVENFGPTTIKDLKLFDDKLDQFIDLDKTTLDPGEKATGKADYTVLSDDRPGPIINNATVTGKDEVDIEVSAEDSAEVRLLEPLTVNKTALQKSVRPGDEVTYLIEIKFNGTKTVNVTDTFNRPVEFVRADPRPTELIGDREHRWENISVNKKRLITLVVRVPKTQDFTFDMIQGVSGEGFVKVANDYRTAPPSYVLNNCVYINESSTPADCESVTVGETGTELQTREYGSGNFDVEERVSIFTANKSIEWEEDLSATYKPTSITLYNNRTVAFDSAWVKKARAKNYVTGTTMTETYHDAVRLDRESRMFLDKNESVMEVDSDFDGRGHIGFLKMPSNTSDPKTTPTFELREDYVGSFKVLQRVDEYGRGVSYEKSAAGSGLVVGDRRIGSSQRSYESGTGAYDSEEIIETATNYIAKDISLVYAPMSSKLTDDVSIEASVKWKEGIYSKTPGISYIGEEYTSIDRLDKESVFRGLNDLSTEADFVGSARYRVVVADRSGNETGNVSGKKRSDALIDFDEVYSGDYSIARRILLEGVPKYDHPHISLSKVGEGNANLSQVHYIITVANDGNAPLENVTIEDTFPRGTAYLSSSRRPDVIAADRAIWSVEEGLAAGRVLNIDLTLDVTEGAGGLVNVVKATANAGNDTVLTASNFSVLEAGWLSCCPDEIFASKTAAVDPVLNNVVLYRLTVQNLQDRPVVARIEDTLPQGMDLLGSSMMPSEHDRSRGLIAWVVADLKPGEVKSIEYLVEARYPGRYLNVAEVDPYTLDGEELRMVSVSAVVEVGPFDEAEAPPCWTPPDWGFLYSPITWEMTCDGAF